MAHPLGAEHHKTRRTPWLRAAVLGANDGIVSTAGLVIGVAAAGQPRAAVVTAGIAGLVAGAMSMAAGEYVSVSSQRDAERADLQIEAAALVENRAGELRELAQIYESRGVEPGLARLVAEQLMLRDPLGAHMRDELGITDVAAARPLQAAGSSALAFTVGALIAVLAVALSPTSWRVPVTAAVSLVALAGLGTTGALLGGAPWRPAAARVLFWSALAMTITWAIGRLVGATI